MICRLRSRPITEWKPTVPWEAYLTCPPQTTCHRTRSLLGAAGSLSACASQNGWQMGGSRETLTGCHGQALLARVLATLIHGQTSLPVPPQTGCTPCLPVRSRSSDELARKGRGWLVPGSPSPLQWCNSGVSSRKSAQQPREPFAEAVGQGELGFVWKNLTARGACTGYRSLSLWALLLRPSATGAQFGRDCDRHPLGVRHGCRRLPRCERPGICACRDRGLFACGDLLPGPPVHSLMTLLPQAGSDAATVDKLHFAHHSYRNLGHWIRWAILIRSPRYAMMPDSCRAAAELTTAANPTGNAPQRQSRGSKRPLDPGTKPHRVARGKGP